MFDIRAQNRLTDPAAIKALNALAFAKHGETAAFDTFRSEREDILSLVAEEHGEIIGHVLFSPVTLATPAGAVMGMGLGQLAVHPARQRQGVGTELATSGIRKLRARGCPFVIVIGHAAYYPRFGFERGALHDIHCQWQGVPEETFMVLMLSAEQREQLTGVASFDGL